MNEHKKKSLLFLLSCKLESRSSKEIWIFTEADRTFCTFHSTFSTEISNISSEHEIGTPSDKERWQAELNFCWRVCWHLSLYFLPSLLPSLPPAPLLPPFILPFLLHLFSVILYSKNMVIVSVSMFWGQQYFLSQ